MAAVALLTHAATLANGFVWDDRFIVLENPVIRSPKNIPAAFGTSLWGHMQEPVAADFYRPLQTVTLIGDYSLWGTRASGYHATNILLHALNAALLTLVLLQLLHPAAAYGAAAIFAAHPALTESVAFVSDRGDLLMTSFLLTSLLAAVAAARDVRTRRMILLSAFSALLFLCGLLAKESAIGFLPVLAAGSLLAAQGGGGTGAVPGARRWISLCRVGLLALAATVYWLARSAVLASTVAPATIRWSFDAEITLVMLAKYCALMVLPHPLNADYLVAPGEPLVTTAQWVALSAAAAFVLFALLRTSAARGILLGLFWFTASLSPVLRILSPDVNLAERYLYLPSAGMLIAAGAAVTGIATRWPPRPTASKVLAAAMALIVCAAGAASIARARVWKSDASLWTDTYRKSPRKFAVANRLLASAPPDTEGTRALAFLDGFFARLRNRGVRAQTPSDFVSIDARSEIHEAARTHRIYATLLFAAGRGEDAAPSVASLAALAPYSSETAFLTGVLALSRARFAEAVASFSMVLRENPNDLQAIFNRGLALERWGRSADARDDYAAVLRLDPGNAGAREGLRRLGGG